MKIIKKIEKMQRWSDRIRAQGKIIGFVPTMGYLHEGHLSLVKIARRSSDYVVVSIFVNPLQFGPKEDLGRYPRDFPRDKRLLKKLDVDVIFYPSVKEMYPQPSQTFVEVPELSKNLCGQSRPGHFRGVCTVVAKLFNIVKPHIAVFGKKDFQQLTIIEQMVRDLNFDIRIVAGPTVREWDGLAMSSRNTYLSEVEHKNATILYQSLVMAKRLVKRGEKDPGVIIDKMKKMITEKGGRIDYIKIVNRETLKDVKRVKKGDIIALAVFFGKTRLIDNISI
ncbi:MAG: pantoate--beta-alanine ligase [candidate division WOR-3 bacterium]